MSTRRGIIKDDQILKLGKYGSMYAVNVYKGVHHGKQKLTYDSDIVWAY